MVTIESILNDAEQVTDCRQNCSDMPTYYWGMRAVDTITILGSVGHDDPLIVSYGLLILAETMKRLEARKQSEKPARQIILNAHANLDNLEAFCDWDASNPDEHVWISDLLMVTSDFFHYTEEIFPNGNLAREGSLAKFAALLAHRIYLVKKLDEGHPLDQAIAHAEEVRTAHFSSATSDYSFLVAIARNIDSCGKSGSITALGRVALIALKWLQQRDSTYTWQAMRNEYDIDKKYVIQTLDTEFYTDETRYFAIMEQIGKITACLPDNCELRDELDQRIAQVGMMALAWIAYEIDKEKTDDNTDNSR